MKGKKIYLRIIERDDIPTTHKWFSNSQLADTMGYLPVFTLEHQYRWFENSDNNNKSFVFAICMVKSGEHIGNVGLGNIDYIHKHAMFNIFIADKANRSQGYGKEATQLILNFGFNKLNLHKIYLKTSERFKEAISLYQGIGFKKEGVLRDHYFTNGHYEDKIMLSILKNEFGHN